MGFASFATLGLKEFIEKESAPGELWIFVHIPKTAGSSFASELSELRRPYRNIHVDYEDETTPYDQKLDKAVEKFLQDGRSTQFQACSGHITMRHVQKIREGFPRSRVVSILRNPVERVISDFRYARTPAHPPYREFIDQFPTIESYVESPESQDKLFKFLAPDPRMQMPALFDFLGESVSFIGLTEMYPMSFNIAMQLFGVNKLPTSHNRKTEPTKHNRIVQTPELFGRIKNLNRRDWEMFVWVKDRLLARREQWFASRSVQSGQDRVPRL